MRLSPGVRYMIAGAFFFSVMSLAVKLAGQRLPTQQIVLARAVVTVALTWAMLRRARVRPWGRRHGLLIVRGVVGFAALSSFYYALVHLPLADATVIQYTNPVWTALLAAWLLHERMSRAEVVLVLLSLAGVVLIARPSFLFGAGAAALDPLAVGVALVGALLSGAAYVAVRSLTRTEDALVIVFYFTVVTVVLSVPWVLLEAVWPTPGEWLVLLGVGVTAQAGQVFLTRGLHLEPAGRATAIGYLQIVFAAVWGVLFFAEYPDLWTLLGALVIVGATLALARHRRRPTRTRAPAAGVQQAPTRPAEPGQPDVAEPPTPNPEAR